MKTIIRARLKSNLVGDGFEIKAGEIVTGETAVNLLKQGMAEIVKDQEGYEKAVVKRSRKVV